MPRGINDLLSTSSDVVAAAFDTDCLSVDRLHVQRHVVLFKRVVELSGGLLTYLIGKHEDVVVLKLEGVVVALVIFLGLMSCLILPHILGNAQRKRRVLGVIINNSKYSTVTRESVSNETYLRVSQNPRHLVALFKFDSNKFLSRDN